MCTECYSHSQHALTTNIVHCTSDNARCGTAISQNRSTWVILCSCGWGKATRSQPKPKPLPSLVNPAHGSWTGHTASQQAGTLSHPKSIHLGYIDRVKTKQRSPQTHPVVRAHGQNTSLPPKLFTKGKANWYRCDTHRLDWLGSCLKTLKRTSWSVVHITLTQ